MKQVDFYYDIVCPYAYLGETQISAIAEARGAEVVWKPFLLGGVIRAIGAPDNQMGVMSPAKLRHNHLDMHRWAEHFGVPLTWPMAHPRRTVLALRALLAAGDEHRVEATMALYRAYWVDGLDITEEAVVEEVLSALGLDGAACVQAAATQAIKDALRSATDEAISRGVFGAPAFFVDGELFWGQDRLDFVARALSASA